MESDHLKQVPRMTTIQTLPEEIILQILSKLPFSSLIRFKCVCKAWNQLSQHPYLSHLYNSDNNNNQCLMLYSHDNPSKDRLCFVDFESNSTDEDISLKEIRLPFCSSSSSAQKLKVIGSCNGLLCLSSSDHNHQYIHNPFTSEYTELPKTSHSNVKCAAFGFGFHPKTKEYKVVKFIYCRASERLERTRRGYFMGGSTVQVFTLGSTCWRDLRPATRALEDSIGKNVIVNGRLHYMSSPYNCLLDTDILSFDLEDEEMREVKKPNSIQVGWSDYLVVLKGCLSVASGNADGIEIWVQREYDVEASWVKWLNIATRGHVPKALRSKQDGDDWVSRFGRWIEDHRVLCELKNGEILLENRSRALVAFDPSNGSFKDVEFQGMPRLFHSVLHLGNLNQIKSIVGSNF